MVKKVINIGVEGNDASGDPIREAFNKVNENFNELYSAFGKGDGISITALSEGPDETPPNTILIMNDDPENPKYLTKELVGEGGIQVINTSSSVLTIKSIASALGSDTSPYLINNLDARGLSILNVANPSQIVANQFNLPNTDSFAINKGYADSRYVNSSGDTMTGPLNVPSNATGNQVPRANETVLKSGGLTSKMNGPLILSDIIKTSDLPLTAATKEYVDLSNYASEIDLYVSTQGSDTLFDIDDTLKGRSYAYAFRTISAACRYAKRLMDESPVTVGITVKDITYNNGASQSEVFTIVGVDDYHILSISNNGTQTDPRDGNDIRPGQVIRGKVSRAIVKIQEIQALFGTYENYRVIYQTDPTENPFIVGEPLEYGNPTKDLNITIFVETGNYYEHYPIRVPENVSIVGSELRRTIVRPTPGRSASWAADVYFRRDTLFDVDLPVADQTFGYHYLTDSNNVLYTGTINNEGAYTNASYILLQNKEYIINEIIGYLNTVEINGTLNLFYDEVKCRRDTGLIITALAYDMIFDSNFASIAAARAYYRGTQAAAVLGNDKIATLDSLDQLKTILLALVTDLNAENRISENIDLMKAIIDDGLGEVPVINWPNTSSILEGFANAKTLISNNKEFLKAEISAYITQQINENISNPSSIWFNLVLDLEKCRRDVQYIVEAVIYDLGYGGNWQTIDAGSAYYFNEFIIASNEKLPTLDAYQVLKERIYAIATNGAFTNYQNIIPRVAGGQPGSVAAGTYASDLVEIIRYIITNDGLLPSIIYPSTTSVGTALLIDFNLMITNNLSIQDQIITYLNTNYFIYDEDLCRRDLGLVIDAIGYDLVYGDYYKSLEAANSYFISASGLLVIQDPTLDPSDPFYNPLGQLQKTLAGFQRLSYIAQRVILKQPPPESYQNLYPTNLPMEISMEQVSEPGADTVVSQLVEFMIKILNRDSEFNPPKQNNELDIFLMNNGTIIRNLSCQEHGGFMCVLDPLGQILTKSPYVQTASSFSRSIDERIFAGGMFCDAFAGNLQATITSKISDTEILVSGLTIRLPNLPCAFYITGVRFQVDLITEWNQVTGNARVHINPATPDTLTYVEDFGNYVPPLFVPSTNIEFLSAGNNSMLSNDYTQLNDLGYGLCAVNGGLLEAVSVFTYYNQISYFADTGGQIRSVSGSSAHGAYGMVAKGAYPLEIPDDVFLLEDMVVGADVYSPFDYYNAVSGTNLSGTGVGATFNIVVNETSYIVTLVNPGTGYINGNQIIFLGAEFGGISGVNDLTISITGSTAGAINTFNYTGTIPEGAPVNDYFNRADDITIYVTNVTPEFKISNGAELEVAFGNAPNRLLFRYLINNAEDVSDNGDFPITPTNKVYRLNLASGGLGAGSFGIRSALPDTAKVTMRQNQSLLIYDINRETATRPSTALVFDEATEYVNRVIAISNVNAKEGTFTWDVTPPATVIECSSSLHGLLPGDEIYIVFAAGSGTSGAPSRGFYTIVTTPTTSTFTVTANVATENFVEGTFTWGQANGECEVQLKEPFRSVVMNSYYNAVDFQAQPYTVSVDRAFSSNNEFNCISSSSLTANDPIKFNGTIGGITSGTTYYVKTIVSETRFTISDTSGGTVRSLTSYAGGVLTATATTAGTNFITVASTSILYTGQTVRFSGTLGGGLKLNTPYYVLAGFTGTQFKVSLTPAGAEVSLSTSVCSMTVTPDPMYGSTDINGANYFTWGVTGSYKFAIRDLSTYDAQRINTNISLGFPMLMGWRGRVHKISNYISSEDNGTPYAVIELDNLGVVSLPLYPTVTGGLIEPLGYLEGGWDNAPNMKAGLQADSEGNVTINISTVRTTGHDMLEVGTGSYASTNFPNVIFGRADRDADQAAEIREIGKGRVFYVTSDQDGNFKVGDFFKVDQGTGTVTFSSSIAISNLDGLGFKRGVAVAEFSVDDSFFDNATDTVPTEQAVRTYVDRRLGLTHNGATINPASGRLIPSPTSGFMSLNGQLPMRANMNLGSFRITNVADPTLNQDATTKVYVDYFLRRQGGTSRIDVESFKMLPQTTFVSGTVGSITGTGPWTAVLTLSTTTGVGVGYQFLATAGAGSIGTGICTVTIVNNVLNEVTFTSTGGTTPINGAVSNIRFFAGMLNMNDNKIVNVATPTNDYDAVTKKYVDDLSASLNELRELGGVDLPNPISTITSNSIFTFNGTNFTWGAQAGDVLFTLVGNTFTSAIQPGVIINSDVNATAAIDQSKLNMTLATTRAAAPTGTAAQKQAASGLASFDTASFNITDGFVTLKGNGLTLSMLPQMSPDTVIGNSGASTATPSEVSFATVVQEGGALYKTDAVWNQNGALVRTGVGAFSIVAYKSAYSESTASDKGTLVLRDATDGGFSASIINATTQFNVKGNRALNQSADATPYLEIRTPQDTVAIATRTVTGNVNGNLYGSWNTNGGAWTNSGTWSLTGNLTLGTAATTTSTINGTWTSNGNWTIQNSTWVLAGTSTLESTYTADIAEYYQGDKEYDVGTVVMIGGDYDITLASGQGTTKVAGVVSNNAAFMMYKECPGIKNLIALQGRVPCKVIGKVFKGDLMVVGIVPGVAMASMDPKPGSIIGKALQNYDSDHVGVIEIMVGKH